MMSENILAQANLDKSLEKLVQAWVSDSIKQNQPRLCCDLDKILWVDVPELICSVVNLCEFELILLSGNIDGENRSIVRFAPLDQFTISHMLKNEGTFSVVDLSQVGGCTFDICYSEESKELCSFLAVAWGAHENCIAEINNRRDDAKIFRGN